MWFLYAACHYQLNPQSFILVIWNHLVKKLLQRMSKEQVSNV